LDNLFSDNIGDCLEATNIIKNLVIGSNKQKKFIIQQGVVPRLLTLLQNEKKPLHLRLNVLIIIGSLAKGTGKYFLK
jgi:Armadillo/beta-catenin-like repeat